MKLSDRISKPGQKPLAPGPKERHQPAATHDIDAVLSQLHAEVIDALDVQRLRQLDSHQITEHVGHLVEQLLARWNIAVNEGQRARFVASIVDEMVGLGPLEPLLADPTVSDILVNTASTVYVERDGVLEQTSVRFRDNAHLLNTISRIVGRIGRRIDEASPMVDARLPDGSRVNAVIPPLAIDGPLLCIRRFGSGVTSMKQLIGRGTLTTNMAQYLQCAVRSKCNIIISGGTGAGKTTLLNALSSFVGGDERIVTIEDAAELRLQQAHVARMESRPPNLEGRGEVAIRDLVRNALRMRPDRIIVGEVRASEVLDMIQAMNTGHEGSMTTIHSNNPRDAVTRLMSMLGLAGTQLSESMMLQMVSRAIHLIVQLNRYSDGRRRISSIVEVAGITEGEPELNEVYFFEQRGVDSARNILGEFQCTGRSHLLERFLAAGFPLHPACLSAST